MSIIIQAGHKSSKSKQLMEKLYERGLSRPANSYTHKMTPQQVSETLYKVLARENMPSANEKITDKIMIDLLLANLDLENWGWESDKNLTSLEYWGQIESDVRFILVFDHPKNLLNNLKSKKITVELINQVMSEWVSYHQTMLDFFEKNQDTSILIECNCALKNINSLGVEVRSIAKTLQLKSSWQVISRDTKSIGSSNAKSPLQINVVKDNVFAEIINKYPEAIKIFNTLLDKTSVKDSDLIYKTKRTSLDSLVESLNYLAFEEDKKCYLSNVETTLEQKELEAQRLNRELQESKSSLANIEINLEQKKLEAQRLNGELQDSNSKRKFLENEIKKVNNRIEDKARSNPSVNSNIENSLLMVQIQQLQEELERYYIESQKFKNNEVSKNERPIKDLEKKPTYYGAVERIKQDLPYRLGEKIVNAKQPKNIVSLPFVLTKEYSNFQKNKVSVKSLPPIELYTDAHEAEKIKKQLSYRLGTVVTTEVKSYKGLVSLPYKIVKEIVNFKLKAKVK